MIPSAWSATLPSALVFPMPSMIRSHLTVGTQGSFSLIATGYPAAIFSETGALPGTVTLSSAGVLSGTPAGGTGGTYPITVTASNGIQAAATQAFTLTVNFAPSVTTQPSSTTATAGSTATFTAAASGNPAPTVQWQVSTNGGAAFANISGATSNTLTLTGVTASMSGYEYRAVFTNSAGSATTSSATLTVSGTGQAPAITSAPSAGFANGVYSTFTVTTTGSPTPKITIPATAILPAGVTFVDNGNGTATLSGNPAVNGNYTFTVTASNSMGRKATQRFTLTVAAGQAPGFTSSASAGFVMNTASSFTVRTSGFPPAAITKSGALPAGIAFTPNTNGTATLSGTSSASGVYQITFTATNEIGSVQQIFTLTVGVAPAITSANNTTFTVLVPGAFTVTTTGIPNPHLSIGAAKLPSGVTFVDDGNGTATLSGTPAAGTGAMYTFAITATDGVTPKAIQSFSLYVDQPPAITSGTSATFATGKPGSFTVKASGYPKSTFIEVGTLPSGVTLSSSGYLSGTPAAGTSGTYPINITATNGIGLAATQSFTLTVNQAPAITSANSASFNVGVSGPTFTIATTGFPTARITKMGSLPKGLSFAALSNGTATITGTPAAGTAGTYELNITANNGVPPVATQTLTLVVH
jgi:hypothetical protein